MSNIRKIELYSKMENYSSVNSEFAKVKIKIAYYDKNRNMTNIPKEAFDKAEPTLKYIPIVGHYISEGENEGKFGGHDQEITINENGIEVKSLTIPYGVVTDEPTFIESVKEINGEYKDYVCCWGYLWIGRYPELEGIKERSFKQSMEITPTLYEIDDDGYFVIKNFEYSALCILETVEPCFESSTISANYSNRVFENEYTDMLNSFKRYSLELEEGGEPMEDEKDLVFKKKRKCSKCEEEIEVEGEFDESEEFICDKCAEETEPQKCPTCGKELDEEGECPECDDTEEDYQAKYNEVVAELNEVKAKFVDMESQYSELNTEVEELRSFKEEVEKAKFEAEEQARKDGIDSQLEIYAELSQCEGYLAIMDKKYEVEVETTELMLKALAYDNDIKIGKKTKKNFSKETVKIPVSNFQSEELTEAEKRYGKGIHKYIKK